MSFTKQMTLVNKNSSHNFFTLKSFNANPLSESKLLFVDYARAIAIMMVVMVHTAQITATPPYPYNILFKYCQMGVQLFFIVSALTLCISHEKRKGEHMGTIKYIIRRFFRIAPLYYFGIAIYFIIAFYFSGYPWPVKKNIDDYNFYNVMTNLLLIHGFFSSANNNIVPGGWSIGCEVIFYGLFPVIYRCADFMHKWRGIKPLILVFVILAVSNYFFQSSYSINTNEGFGNNGFWYYSIVNQLPVFWSGIVVYYSMKKNLFKSTAIKALILSLSFLSLAICLYLWDSKNPLIFSLLPAITAIPFSMFLLLSGNLKLKKGMFSSLGQHSYSVYILHFIFCFYALRLISNSITIKDNYLLIPVYYSTALIGSYALSILTYKIIELPGIKAGNIIASKIKSKTPPIEL